MMTMRGAPDMRFPFPRGPPHSMTAQPKTGRFSAAERSLTCHSAIVRPIGPLQTTPMAQPVLTLDLPTTPPPPLGARLGAACARGRRHRAGRRSRRGQDHARPRPDPHLSSAPKRKRPAPPSRWCRPIQAPPSRSGISISTGWNIPARPASSGLEEAVDGLASLNGRKDWA
jgi:hypothetical protein